MTVGTIWQVVAVAEAAPVLWADYRCRRVGQLIRHQLIMCLRDCCFSDNVCQSHNLSLPVSRHHQHTIATCDIFSRWPVQAFRKTAGN